MNTAFLRKNGADFKMPDVCFTADFHFGRHNIIRHYSRPFNDVAHMEAQTIDSHNKTVEKGGPALFSGRVLHRRSQAR